MISRNIVIMTKTEFDEMEHAAFKRGVARGKFEESCARSNSQAQGSAGQSGATENTGSASPDAAVRPANSA